MFAFREAGRSLDKWSLAGHRSLCPLNAVRCVVHVVIFRLFMTCNCYGEFIKKSQDL
jgi:hypothetical protein